MTVSRPSEAPNAATDAPENDGDANTGDVKWANDESPATALTWLDPSKVHVAHTSDAQEADDNPSTNSSVFEDAHLKSTFAGRKLLAPAGVLAGLLTAYATATLLWPLDAVSPSVRAVKFAPAAAPAAAIAWPGRGSAAVGVDGIGTASSTLDPAAIASVTKVVSSLMVLDRMPLAVGEQGPQFSFTWADSNSYWAYRRSDQSALDVPVGGTLTEYQLLQGTLMGSANNYIDRLAQEIWGSDDAFADAAAEWLRDRGIKGITIVTPSGFDERNTATPAALVELAQTAMRNPVFASIVRTPSVTLPGAGTVVNTNEMLADPGVVGVKTGTLNDSWNLLTAKNVTVGDTTVQLYSAVLGQADNDERLAATRSLFAQVEKALKEQPPVVEQGTRIGRVETVWGASVDVVVKNDADVVLWNGAAATATPKFDLDDKHTADDKVGTLTTSGPLNTATTDLVLAADLDGPSAWWRLSHPLELFGLLDDE